MAEPATYRPTSPDELTALVAWAVGEEQKLEVVGNGSKRGLGRPVEGAHRLELSGLSGVAMYEPEELVMTAAAGTPLAQVEAELAECRQELAFEPADYGAILGGEPGGRRSAACSPATSRARGGSRPGRRATICWACAASPARGRRSRPAAGWSRTSPATTCASCSPAPTARWRC